MISFFKKSACLVCAAAAVLALGGCGGRHTKEATPPDVTEIITLPTAPATEATVPETDPREQVEELAVVMAAGELYTLDYYPNLKSVDLSGSICYDAILDYIAKHPNVEVTYTVDLGGTAVANTVTAITLEPGSFDYDILLTNLGFLPSLASISLPDVELNAEQINAILTAYPEITLDYTVELFGDIFGVDTTEMDLSSMGSSQVEEATERLGLLTNLTAVKLSNSLPMEDVAALQDSCPQAAFQYSFNLFGKTVSTTDTEIIYKNQNIGNDGEDEVRQALEILDACERFVLDNCKIDYDVLSGIREDFRDGPKVVWRVYFGKDSRYNALTDDEMIRAVYNVMDENVGPLVYCEGAKYIDMGHNETLTDLSFVSGMPNLEVLIASGCAVKELVGFENCKNLTWLELAYCYKLEDITALEGCESLQYLNIAYSKVTDYVPLDGLPLKRFMCLSPKASTEEQNIFVEIHPKAECITVFYGYSNPYGYGWRYDDNGKTFNEYYKNVIRKAFNYEYLETLLPKEET